MSRPPCSHPDHRVRWYRSRSVPLPIAGMATVDVGRCGACCRELARIRSGDDSVTFEERDTFQRVAPTDRDD